MSDGDECLNVIADALREMPVTWSPVGVAPRFLAFIRYRGFDVVHVHVPSRDCVPESTPVAPIPMRLHCPECGDLHIDEGEFATKQHHTHACQSCGNVWRPAVVHTVGVQFLPGFKDEPQATEIPK